jgi:hypothetical protein
VVDFLVAPTTLQKQIDRIAIAGLPHTIQFAPGSLSICCRNMQHLVEQLVLVAKALDTDYQALQQQIENMPTRKPVGPEIEGPSAGWSTVTPQSQTPQ